MLKMKVQLKNISKSFNIGNQKINVLSNVSIDIPSGSLISIRGESGTGKTTLLSVIGLLDLPDNDGGDILHDNKSIKKISKKEYSVKLREIGFVFQKFHLIASLNVLNNVMLPLMIQRKTEYNEDYGIDLLKKVGIEHRARHYPNEISGGELQRVCIARAIANKPKLILADEPTGNLDSNNSENVIKLLHDLAVDEKATLICVTHSEKVASRFNKTIYMDQINGLQPY